MQNNKPTLIGHPGILIGHYPMNKYTRDQDWETDQWPAVILNLLLHETRITYYVHFLHTCTLPAWCTAEVLIKLKRQIIGAL